MIILGELLKMFPEHQLVSLADKDGSGLPYGYRETIHNIGNHYEDEKVLNLRICADVLYIRLHI